MVIEKGFISRWHVVELNFKVAIIKYLSKSIKSNSKLHTTPVSLFYDSAFISCGFFFCLLFLFFILKYFMSSAVLLEIRCVNLHLCNCSKWRLDFKAEEMTLSWKKKKIQQMAKKHRSNKMPWMAINFFAADNTCCLPSYKNLTMQHMSTRCEQSTSFTVAAYYRVFIALERSTMWIKQYSNTVNHPRMQRCEILIPDWSLSWQYWHTDCRRKRVGKDR